MVVTNNPEIAQKLAMLRNHGCQQKYYHLIPGFNSRLDELQAAILRVKLRHIGEWIEQRRWKASLYAQLFDPMDGVEPPYVAPYSYHIFNYYTIRLVNCNNVGETLQEVYKDLGYKPGDFPIAESASARAIALPFHNHLTKDQVEIVCTALKQLLAV